MRWNLNKTVTAGFAVVFTIWIFAVFISFRSMGQLIETSRQLTRSQQVLETLEKILITMDDAETGQRGYLLTGKDSYLAPYKAAAVKLPEALESLSKLTASNASQQHRMGPLEHLIKLKQEELAATIKLRRTERSASAAQIVLSGLGKQEMDGIRMLIGKMEEAERNQLRAKTSQQQAGVRRTTLIVAFGVVIAFAVLLISILILNRESSERIRADRALRQSEVRLRLLLDSVRDYAIFMLDPRSQVMSWNPGAEKTLGYSEAESLGQSFSIFFTREDVEAEKPQRELHEALANGRTEDEGWRVRKDGSRFWANVVVAVVRDEQGRLQGFSKVTRDITDRKRAQQEIQKLNQDLERRAVQLETTNKELEAFTYSVSHDLRAPLRHLDGFSQLLVEEYGSHLPEEVRRYLNRIRRAARQMGQLVDDLLNLARVSRQPIKYQVTGLPPLVEQVVSKLKTEIGGRTIQWNIEPLPFVECDPPLLKQVFANLLSNAVKYTRPRERAVIEIGSVSQDGRTAIFVRDNGVGFSMKYSHKLFGVFQRLHRAEDFEGTGVGLAIVQRIIHKHGGHVWAEAELDKGATFYFTLGSPAS